MKKLTDKCSHNYYYRQRQEFQLLQAAGIIHINIYIIKCLSRHKDAKFMTQPKMIFAEERIDLH